MDLNIWTRDLLASSQWPVLAALLVGVLASIGPCPLTSNIAALSYMARQFGNARTGILTGVLYVLGRALAYGIVGLLVLVAGAQVAQLAGGLQGLADFALGPLLIAVGFVLLDVVKPNLTAGSGWLARAAERVVAWPVLGAFLLGAILALAFCPYSAALYFGILIPLASRTPGGTTLPLVFGVGTGVPVLLLGLPLVTGLKIAATGLDRLERIEPIVRRLSGYAFVGAGLYSVGRFVQATIGSQW